MAREPCELCRMGLEADEHGYHPHPTMWGGWARCKALGSETQEEISRRSRARSFMAASLRYDGMNLKQIGDRLGVGKARAGQLVATGQRRMDFYFKSLNECAEIAAKGLIK